MLNCQHWAEDLLCVAVADTLTERGIGCFEKNTLLVGFVDEILTKKLKK